MLINKTIGHLDDFFTISYTQDKCIISLNHSHLWTSAKYFR